MKNIYISLSIFLISFGIVLAQVPPTTLIVWNKTINVQACVPRYDTLYLNGDYVQELEDGSFVLVTMQGGGLGFTITKTTNTGDYVWNNLVEKTRTNDTDSGFHVRGFFLKKDTVFVSGYVNPKYLWGDFGFLFDCVVRSSDGNILKQDIFDSSLSHERIPFFGAVMTQLDSTNFAMLGTGNLNSKVADMVTMGKLGQKVDWKMMISSDSDSYRRPIVLSHIKVGNQGMFCLIGHNSESPYSRNPNTIYLTFLSTDGKTIFKEIRLKRKITEIPIDAYCDKDKIVILTQRYDDSTKTSRIIEIAFDGTIINDKDIYTINGSIRGNPSRTVNGGWIVCYAGYTGFVLYDSWLKIERNGIVSAQYNWMETEDKFFLSTAIECKNGEILASGNRNGWATLDMTRFRIIANSVDEFLNVNDALIFPNPCLDFVEISFPTGFHKEIIDNIEIIDILGVSSILGNENVEFADGNTIRVNVQTLSPGVYHIKLHPKLKPMRFVKL